MKNLLRSIRKMLLNPALGEISELKSALYQHVQATQEWQSASEKRNHDQHIRDLIQQRWKIYGALDSARFDNFDFSCPICHQPMNTSRSKKYETECIFLGGRLLRYACDHCGVITGPLKMYGLSQEEFDLDYIQHYTLFSEGDTTEFEKQAFAQMQPEKGGVYLNYGCGTWSRSLEELRSEGWNVYGYEPYAGIASAPHILTSEEVVKSMRFDGIFSNNVLEHYRNPLDVLKFQKNILKDKSSIMVHATPCYEYLYEYTRFHVNFYLGNSIHVLSRQAGLEAFGRHDTVFFGHPYTSYKFRQIANE
ncbi:MAG: class I SAM-dependent methyltransferase [Azonexus sp.]|jgi:hypothetical protein|uniref:methyltransferase domain-containing protein n=1 Tax=Azonexus sp. TaxID=1872668 RepID=UPI0028211104|nr:methyltransferase domain-containing protein [Azonexus sp.]MDR0775418.1 class I SAM-dependent methyltransferase [Azonexus sp.]